MFHCLLQDSLMIDQVAGGSAEPVVVPVTLTAGVGVAAASPVLTVMATYTTQQGEPRTTVCQVGSPPVSPVSATHAAGMFLARAGFEVLVAGMRAWGMHIDCSSTIVPCSTMW